MPECSQIEEKSRATVIRPQQLRGTRTECTNSRILRPLCDSMTCKSFHIISIVLQPVARSYASPRSLCGPRLRCWIFESVVSTRMMLYVWRNWGCLQTLLQTDPVMPIFRQVCPALFSPETMWRAYLKTQTRLKLIASLHTRGL